MNKCFKKVRKGYDPEEVDNYIRELEAKINDYKEKEKAISETLVKAQITADNIIHDAKNQSSFIEQDTVKQLKTIKSETIQLKTKIEQFQKEYNRLIQDYLVTLRSQDLIKLFNDLDTLIDYLDEHASKKTDTDESTQEAAATNEN